MSEVALLVRRRIKATPERIFEAWTTPEQLLRWWGPHGVRCTLAEIDLRVGGRYRLDNLLPGGKSVSITGEFIEIDRPRKLIYSWTTSPEATPEIVTLRLEPAGEHTELTIAHERIADDPTRQAHELGWIGCLDGLEVELI